MRTEDTPAQSILKYLERDPCKNCSFEDGEVKHCIKCLGLLHKAIFVANELSKNKATNGLSAERNRALEVSAMKNTHDWVASGTYLDPGRTRMVPAGNCRRCKINIMEFKANPAECPKKQ